MSFQTQSTTVDAGTSQRVSPDHSLARSSSPSKTQEPSLSPSVDVFKVEEGHSRPLPPPLNPKLVRRQAMKLYNWTAVDGEDDVMIATLPQKRNASDLDTPDVAMATKIGVEPIHRETLNLKASAISGEASDCTPSKKRRLFQHPQGKVLTGPGLNQILPKWPEEAPNHGQGPTNRQYLHNLVATHSTGAPRPLLHVFEEDSADSAESDLDVNSEEKETASFSGDSDDEGLLKYYARLHGKSMSGTETDSHRNGSAGEGLCSITSGAMNSVFARKEKEEHESAERSRLLRERKLGMASNGYSDETGTKAQAFESTSNAANTMKGVNAGSVDASYSADHHQNKDSPPSRPTSTHIAAQPPDLQTVNADLDDFPSPHNEINVETLLDTSQDYNQSNSSARIDFHNRNRRQGPTSSRNLAQHKPNPYSRAAAESFRTQSRHLDNPSKSGTHTDMAEFDRAADARLRHFTQTLEKSKSAVQYLQPNCISAHEKQVCQARRLPSPLRDDGMFSSGSSSRLIVTDRTAKSSPISCSKPHLTSLQLQALKNSQGARQEQSDPPPEAPSANFAPLGKSHDIDLDNADEVREESERLKCQKKDLKVIKETFEKIATLRSVGNLFEKEEEELKECRRFVNIVIDKGQSGRARRSRMHNIRDNMEARLARIDVEALPQDHAKVQEFYEDFIGKQRAIMIEETLGRIDEEIEDFGVQRARHRQSSKYKNDDVRKKVGAKPQVRFAVKQRVRWEDVQDKNGCLRTDLPSGTEIALDGLPASKPKPRKLNKTEREIKALTERVKLFETGQPSTMSSNTPPQLDDGSTHGGSDSDQPGSKSGDKCPGSLLSFTSSSTFSRCKVSTEHCVGQDLDEINRLEDERQRSEVKLVTRTTVDGDTSCSRQSSQLFDPSIITSMKAKYSDGAMPQVTGGAEGEDEELFDVWTDNDSTVSTESAFSESDFDEIVQVYRYQVVGRFVGVGQYRDADEISFARFHTLGKANERVQAIISSIHREYGIRFGDDFELQTRYRDGLLEQVLSIGGNEETQARVRVERELKEVNVRRLNASKAQKRQLSNQRKVYQVTWEKTTTTIFNPSAITSAPPANDHDEDLFGPELPLGLTTVTEVERCPDPVIHQDLAAANQMAKEDFMVWYSQFFPDSERQQSQQSKRRTIVYNYSGFLRQVNDAHERKLSVLADTGLYEAEEEVERTIDGEEGGEVVGKAPCISKVVKERMRVYVEIKPVLGPAN